MAANAKQSQLQPPNSRKPPQLPAQQMQQPPLQRQLFTPGIVTARESIGWLRVLLNKRKPNVIIRHIPNENTLANGSNNGNGPGAALSAGQQSQQIAPSGQIKRTTSSTLSQPSAKRPANTQSYENLSGPAGQQHSPIQLRAEQQARQRAPGNQQQQRQLQQRRWRQQQQQQQQQQRIQPPPQQKQQKQKQQPPSKQRHQQQQQQQPQQQPPQQQQQQQPPQQQPPQQSQPAVTTLIVVCPKDVKPGQPLRVKVGTGQVYDIVVPANVKEGDKFSVQLSSNAQTQQQHQVAGKPPNTGAASSPGEHPEPPNRPPEPKLPGWKVEWSGKWGRWYWWNTETRKTSWRNPDITNASQG